MTWNILHGPARRQPPWSARREAVVAAIRRANPDMVALQEVSEEQLDDLAAALPELAVAAGPLSGRSRLDLDAGVAARIGAGAALALWLGTASLPAHLAAGALALAALAPVALVRLSEERLGDFLARGELCPVLWNPERLELVDDEAYWLSPMPEVAGSRMPGTLGPRMVHRVMLRDRADGACIALHVTHLGHAPWAARGSARLLRARLAADPAAAQVVCGDLNARPASALLRELTAAEGLAPALRDAWTQAATRRGPEATFPAGRHRPRWRIDHLLVRGPLEVREIATLEESGSDHLPVLAVLEHAAP